jgi:hypothetical protein
VPQSLVYDPVTNPGGTRCTIQENHVNALGIDSETGFARRPLDNVGVQYGLRAFNAGLISAEQFLDLNERIGGFDKDANIVLGRTVADNKTLRVAYALGRVNTGSGGLESVPIIDARPYSDTNPDIHDRVRSLMTRERLIAANGHAHNHVILTSAGTGNIGRDITDVNSPWSALVAEATLQMEHWLDNITNDSSPYHSKAEKVVRNRPRDLVDACYTASGQKIVEPASFSGTGQCNQLFPVHSNPRLAAGGPLADDVIKCQLKPVAANDYARPLTGAQLARLKAAFSQGVCDYTKRGVGQEELKATWLAYPKPGKPMKLGSDDRHDHDD